MEHEHTLSCAHRFVVTMQHDKGRIRIETVARTAEVATDLVCRYEHAPRSAVVGVREIAS